MINQLQSDRPVFDDKRPYSQTINELEETLDQRTVVDPELPFRRASHIIFLFDVKESYIKYPLDSRVVSQVNAIFRFKSLFYQIGFYFSQCVSFNLSDSLTWDTQRISDFLKCVWSSYNASPVRIKTNIDVFYS